MYGAGQLSYRQFSGGGICPEILGVPACYVVLANFVLPLGAHAFGGWQWLYFAGTGLAWSIAAYGTTAQIAGWAECPKTGGGTPMCFISLGVFTALIVLKLVKDRLV